MWFHGSAHMHVKSLFLLFVYVFFCHVFSVDISWNVPLWLLFTIQILVNRWYCCRCRCYRWLLVVAFTLNQFDFVKDTHNIFTYSRFFTGLSSIISNIYLLVVFFLFAFVICKLYYSLSMGWVCLLSIETFTAYFLKHSPFITHLLHTISTVFFFLDVSANL